jgi:hypothetical protein
LEGRESDEETARRDGELLMLSAGGWLVRGLRGGGVGWYTVGCEKGEDFGLGQVETKGFEGDFEFVVVYSLVFVEVK